MAEYVELQTTTNFSFLRGASQPHEYLQRAFELGYGEIGISDRNSLAGVVRAHSVAKQNGMRALIGTRLDLEDGPSLLAYPTNKAAYSRLSNLLTVGNLRTQKGECQLFKQDVYDHCAGIKLIVIPPLYLNDNFSFGTEFENHLNEYKKAFGRNLYIAASFYYLGQDHKRLHALSRLGSKYFIPLVATNDVHYHDPKRRKLQDALTCVREKCTVQTAGYKLHANAERHLKSVDEMIRLFKDYPSALKKTVEIAKACQFSLDELKYEYPHELTTDGRTAFEELEYLTWQGAKERFGDSIPDKIRTNIEGELAFVKEVNYAPYFLTVHDIVRFARSRDILCQGRGSAANSTICYCLGITSVDPSKFDLLFERFVSSARNEPPDIDVDFEHERREEVMQYIFERYGRDRAAIVATVSQYRQKSAIRDIGKAMGWSLDAVERMASSIWEFTDEWFEKNRIDQIGMDSTDPWLAQAVDLSHETLGFGRHLGQHTGGFVISNDNLADLCPIMNARMEGRTCIEWNKDDIDALGFMKIDVLALGMLTCISKSLKLLNQNYGINYNLAQIPQDDPATYDMICDADTIGVFQIESRAQQSMLPRLKPRCFYDLVIEVAIVRPGPIQGDMVHPYLRRRMGQEPVSYPSKELEQILSRTLGVPLFQEQAMKIAIVAAGFSAAEADQLRRSMATFKFKGLVNEFEEKLIKGMMANGYSEDYAIKIFHQLEGFGSYGFPESHAASFAHLVYASSWIKCHYPDVFCCGLLNSMPMGFYQPAQIVRDAIRHKVKVRPVDINSSDWDNKLEEKDGKYRAVRLGFRQVKGLRQKDMEILCERRGDGYKDIVSLWRVGITPKTLEKLADANAFRSIGLTSRQALWEISKLKGDILSLFAGLENEGVSEDRVVLPKRNEFEQVMQDYSIVQLSLLGHPVEFVRGQLQERRIAVASDLKKIGDGQKVKVAGLPLIRQRPGTAGGVCFMTIEDETGFVNLVIFEHLFDRFRREILNSQLLMAEGDLQIEDGVTHVIVKRLYDVSSLLFDLTENDDFEKMQTATNKRTQVRVNVTQQELDLPQTRNFR